MKALCPVIVVRSSVQNPATIPCDQRLFQGLSTASPVRAPSGRNRFHCRRTKTVGLRPTVLVRCLMAGMAGRRSGRNGCFGPAAAGVLHGARTIPTVAGRSMRALSRLADVAGFWTLDLTTITRRSAVILRHHTAAVSSYDCTFDDLELVHQSLRTLEPAPYAQIFARQCAGLQIRPHSTLGRERFFKAGPRASSGAPTV